MNTVFVGLSGGVDSAVSAYLLQKAGYKVHGAFIKVWEPDWLPCTSGEDRLDAMRVAASLGIPFHTYDLAEEYKREVVDYFVDEYRAGRTPNPDVMCNRAIKFGAFWERAKADGADYIATGHYAQIEKQDESYKMKRGIDPNKDQSYFLWTLTQDDLAHVLFPVGALPKSQVREIATEAGLPNAAKRDSQGLCFLGHVDMQEFLMRMLPAEPGDSRLYTLGQKVDGKYVVAKDVATNTVVTATDTTDAGGRIYELGHVNWIQETPDPKAGYEAEVRYHGEHYPVRIVGSTVIFDQPVLAAIGQSLVVYDPKSGECVGGGIIASCRLS